MAGIMSAPFRGLTLAVSVEVLSLFVTEIYFWQVARAGESGD